MKKTIEEKMKECKHHKKFETSFITGEHAAFCLCDYLQQVRKYLGNYVNAEYEELDENGYNYLRKNNFAFIDKKEDFFYRSVKTFLYTSLLKKAVLKYDTITFSDWADCCFNDAYIELKNKILNLDILFLRIEEAIIPNQHYEEIIIGLLNRFKLKDKRVWIYCPKSLDNPNVSRYVSPLLKDYIKENFQYPS